MLFIHSAQRELCDALWNSAKRVTLNYSKMQRSLHTMENRPFVVLVVPALYSRIRTSACIINPRCACAARVTVLGSVCVISRMSNRAINKRAYSVACERQKICGDLPERKDCVQELCRETRAKKPIMLIYQLTRGQLFLLNAQRSTKGYPTSIKDIQPCPKRCLLMFLARVGVVWRSLPTAPCVQLRREAWPFFPRTRISIARDRHTDRQTHTDQVR